MLHIMSDRIMNGDRLTFAPVEVSSGQLRTSSSSESYSAGAMEDFVGAVKFVCSASVVAAVDSLLLLPLLEQDPAVAAPSGALLLDGRTMVPESSK